jgi:phosphoesterase RecJ-like protein
VGTNLSPFLINLTEKHVIVIDHHRNPENFGDSEIIDSNASSTCELVFNLIKSNGDLDLIDIPIAESIYIGLITDTGSFKYSSVSSSTHLIASSLKEIGLNHANIHNNIFDQNSVSKINLLGYALQKIKIDKISSLAYLVLSQKELEQFNFQKGDSEGFVNYCLSIKNIKNAVFLREDKNLIKISLRSKGDVKMNEFSHKFYAGGGHQNAAGAAVESNDINTVTKKLIENFRSFCSV